MIELENVSMTYPGGIEALKNVNINIEKGEFVFIVGSSGSGKTTLFKLLLKEMAPTEGNITVAGYDYGKIKKRDIPKVRRRIGIVFQNFRLLKDRTIYENVAFAQRVIQTPARYIRRRVPAMLTLVGLADKYKSYPKELSGGEQQRVAMARALVNNPDIILADEPTGNLDPKNSLDIMNLLEDINKRGTTVVVVTHNKDIVNEMKKRVITLKKGVIISDEREGGYIDEDEYIFLYPQTGICKHKKKYIVLTGIHRNHCIMSVPFWSDIRGCCEFSVWYAGTGEHGHYIGVL